MSSPSKCNDDLGNMIKDLEKELEIVRNSLLAPSENVMRLIQLEKCTLPLLREEVDLEKQQYDLYAALLTKEAKPNEEYTNTT